jgi:ABC-type transport system substrate-binding protein
MKYGPGGNANNTVGYNNPEFDKLSDQADAEPDPTKSLQLYSQAQALLLKDSPVVFILNIQVDIMVNPKVKNLLAVPLDGGFAGSQDWEDVDVTS